MRDRVRTKHRSKYLVLMVVFLLMVNISLGYLLMTQTESSIITLMQTRMLDISNTAAAMIDGDALKAVTPADEGTEAYESIMRTLTFFQNSIDLKYIYCIRDMGDGSFTFGLDPTVEDPGEFGSPIVYTDALYKASKGIPAADEDCYEDAWGTFYSAYSPVFDSHGEVAGIIAVDFSAQWYNQQLASLTHRTVIVALVSLLVGGAIVLAIITKNERKIGSIHGQLNELASTLMHEMGSESAAEAPEHAARGGDESVSMDELEKQIQTMQTELKTQIAQVHGQAYRDGLTGVKSKHAYLEAEKELNAKLAGGLISALAVVVCDVNGLKKINDTMGHKAGDEYIRKACEMICDIFVHSPVYRIGGDEFTVLITGRDYENRRALMYELHKSSTAHIATDEAIVSGGMAEYNSDQDHCVQDIFERADADMYREKMLLKSLGAVTRDDESERKERNAESADLSILNVRRHILIADDAVTNREMLGDLLAEDYDIYYASDGIETMETLRAHKDEIALLLLDLYMPNMTGREVMKAMQVDEELMAIPVIVLTVDQYAELDCLKIGAMDFIPKPYPDIEIVKARIAKCIELSENRNLILHTQRDKLTGLFNVDYFLRYVERLDQQYRDSAMDAIVCNVNHLYEIHERYGRNFGDLVMRSIGISVKKLARKTGGIGCRKGSDTFLIYCPHQDNIEQLFRRFLTDVFVEKDTASKVTIRFGVCPNAEREKNIEERFACAQIAADSIEDDPQKICGFYHLQS